MLLTILLSIISVVIPIVLPYILKLLKINIDKAEQDKLVQIIIMAIRYAEEMSRKKQLTSEDKENLAVTFAKNNGVTLPETELRSLIKAILNEVRK